MLSFPVLSTRLFVCFLSPFLASLPQLFHECLPCAFAFGLFPFLPVSFVPFCSGSDYSAFLFFRSVLPGSALQLPSRCCPLRFRFAGFPLPFRPVSRASLPIIVLGFSAGFLSSFPVPLPQPLSWCFPSSGSLRPLLFGLFPSGSLSFVRSPSVLTTQLSASSFPLLPGFPWQRFFRYAFPFRFACFHASLPVFGIQPSVLPFSHARFASQMASSFAAACLSV